MIRFIAVMLAFTSSFSINAGAEDIVSKLTSQHACGERMSCQKIFIPMSVVQTKTEMMSKRLSYEIDELTACTRGFHGKNVKDFIRMCEVILNENGITQSQRARVMFALGHTYTYLSSLADIEKDPKDLPSVKMWIKSSEADPTFIEPLLALATCFSSFDKHEEAQMTLDLAETRMPNNWRVFTARAAAFHAAQNDDAELAASEKAFLLAPDEPEVNYARGVALLKNRKHEDAIKQLTLAAAGYDPMADDRLEVVRPESPWIILARAHKEMGKPDLAAQAITSYFEERPFDKGRFDILQQRAEYYELAGQYKKAATDLAAAASLAPPDLTDSLNAQRATLLAKLGANAASGNELRLMLDRATLKPILQFQVFLRNQGFNEVTINGKYDDATKHALDLCLKKQECKEAAGQAI